MELILSLPLGLVKIGEGPRQWNVRWVLSEEGDRRLLGQSLSALARAIPHAWPDKGPAAQLRATPRQRAARGNQPHNATDLPVGQPNGAAVQRRVRRR